MQHANTFKHPMRTGDDVTVVDMRHLGRTKRQLIVDKGAPAGQHLRSLPCAGHAFQNRMCASHVLESVQRLKRPGNTIFL